MSHQQVRGRFDQDGQVVALGGDRSFDGGQVVGQAVDGEQALGAAPFAAFQEDLPGLPGVPGLGERDVGLGVLAAGGAGSGGRLLPAGERGAVQERGGVGDRQGLQERRVMGAVAPQRHLGGVAAGQRGGAADVGVPDGQGERLTGAPERGGAHAQLAGRDAGDGGQQAPTAVAEVAAERAAGAEAALRALQQRLRAEAHVGEGGQAVVDRRADARLQQPYVHARRVQGDDEQHDALVRAVDDEPGGDEAGLGAAGGTGVGHELGGGRAGSVQDEAVPVADGGGLQLGGVVAVAELGAQERADAFEMFVAGQGAAVVGEAAEEEVVVDAGHGREAAVDGARPLVERRQPLGVADERGDVADGGVDLSEPVVGELDALGEGQVRARGEGLGGQQGAPGLVDGGETVAEQGGGEVGGQGGRRHCRQLRMGRSLHRVVMILQ
ncbi:hypothetical protein MF672_017050 [Actinomadura sp. ATCC 31491]|uniref:Uncharacterized protein n=1 Tax=Actinomadura luzonensis TaxID=2805427 RepID=A0ABT0FT18_9ACTN|nr:hypothetical protein [Actinomadura luzonensis]